MALFVTLGMLLPLAFPCTPTHCTIKPGDTTPTCPPGESQHMQYAPPKSLHPFSNLAFDAVCPLIVFGLNQRLEHG